MKHNKSHTGISRKKPTHQHGFTLVELLVVITIVLVLATLVVVMTGKIKQKAYQANALSALRQVAAFNMAYSTENNGDINMLRYPTTAKEGAPSWVKNTFWGRLQPYMFPEITTSDAAFRNEMKQRLDGLFKTDTGAGSGTNSNSTTMPNTVVAGSRMYRDSSTLAIPFGFNTNLQTYSTTAPFKKISSFNDPSQVIYAAYGYGLFDEADGQAYAARPTNNTKPANNIYYLEDRKALTAFLDGHVESLAAPIPSRKFQ